MNDDDVFESDGSTEPLRSIIDIRLTEDILTDNFAYSSSEMREEIYEVLVTWKKIKKFRLCVFNSERSDGVLPVRRLYNESIRSSMSELLTSWLRSQNKYKEAVALMESLPTQMLRRTLEYYDIDFVSMESCLRRITPEQMDGLRHTYQAFEARCIPDCYTKGLGNRLDKWRRPDNHKAEAVLLTKNYDFTHRYTERHTRVMNIAGLDFGYHKYLSLSNDNEESSSVTLQAAKLWSPGKEVSVNKLFGIYAFLYAMLPIPRRKEVGSWFCPGFHVTWLGWLMILIGSPIALMFVIPAYTQSVWYVFPLLLAGSVLPLMLTAALAWHLYTHTIGKEKRAVWHAHMKSYGRENFNAKYWKGVAKTIYSYALGALHISLSVFAGFGIYHWFWESIPLAVIYGVFAFLWVQYMIQESDNDTAQPWNMKGLRMIGIALSIFLVLCAGNDCIIRNWSMIWGFVVLHSSAIVYTTTSSLFIVSLVLIDTNVSERKERIYLVRANRDVILIRKLRTYMSMLCVPLTMAIVGTIFLIYRVFTTTSESSQKMFLIVVPLACTGLAFLFWVYLTSRIDLDTLVRTRRFYNRILKEKELGLSLSRSCVGRLLKESKWIISLPYKKQREVLRILCDIVDDVFGGMLKTPNNFWSMTERSYIGLKRIHIWNEDCLLKLYHTDDCHEKLMCLVLEGATVEQAIAHFNTKKAAVAMRESNLKKFFERIFYPVTAVFRSGRAFYAFIKELLRSCPRVSGGKMIQ